MSKKIYIKINDLIIFKGISRKNGTPYAVVQFRKKIMFNDDYISALALSGVEVHDMTEVSID